MYIRSCTATVFILGSALLGACGSSTPSGQGKAAASKPGATEPAGAEAGSDRPPGCELVSRAPEPLPEVDERYLSLEYWLEELAGEHDLDEVLLSPEDIDALNAGLAVPRDRYFPQRDLLAPVDWPTLERQVGERRDWARDRLASGEYVHGDGSRFAPDELAALDHEVSLAGAAPELRVALDDVPIRCAPVMASFYAPAEELGDEGIDPRLDRNSCSAIRPQQVVRVVRAWPGGMMLVQARHSFGWIAASSALSPPVPEELQEAFVRGVRLDVVDGPIEVSTGDGDRVTVAERTRLAAADARRKRAYVATPGGFVRTAREHARALRTTRRGLTRRALLEEAWRYLGLPYGLGGTGGGRDCSRLLMDVFESFGIELPRHSSWQARAGSFWLDVSEVTENERRLLIDAAADKGVVLLSFPGHIMLYLGRNDRGEPMALHAFREYLAPCSGDYEETVRVDDVTVSNLELGRGTSRTAFIERITHITVLGKPPGVELGGVARLRPTAEAEIPRRCKNRRDAALFVSPDTPNKGQPLRVMAALDEDPGPVALTLIDPEGARHTPPAVRLGGPPYGLVATVEQPRRGRWKVVLADGPRVLACRRVRVRSRPPEPEEPHDGPVWMPTREWTRATENLYSLFVERLFDYPLEDDQVWPNLHTLVRDSERNILYNHLSLDEDAGLELEPDCADLPYTLRAYFAWKMRLPFGYRRCTRARRNRPPECDRGGNDNLMSRLELVSRMRRRDDVTAFWLFAHRHIRSGVHSSAGRTLPGDDETDFYPVPLTREALRPGTLFADPYGHLLVVADWIPQGADSYGVLVGADAQPDGTVGRRRFWRGSFLFDPDTSSGGAGFKAFRPRTYVEEPITVAVEDREDETVERVGYTEEVTNEDLRRTRRYTRYSTEQYRGTADDFYATMEALINPRPLDATAMQRSLVDALAETVSRRVTSVDNGEAFMAERDYAPIDMPRGASIFLTTGPWEDYSTPSRDLRLLIAIDSVVKFPQMVREAPGRFGLSEDRVDEAVAELEAFLQRELASRSFTYTRSDGSEWTLTLKDVVDRSERFEMAYNPNDCVEIRWSAAPGSEEMATCERHAPEEQRARMDSYRSWFATRKRPPQ